jgi:hypothetical protein
MLDITRRLVLYRDKFGCDVYFTNEKGIVQAHNDISLIGNRDINTYPGISVVASSILKNREGQKSFRVSRDGHEIHLISRYIPEFNWHLIVEIDESGQLYDVKKNAILTFLAGC